MVVTPEKVNVLLSMAGLLALWALWSFGLRPALIDSFRQQIFTIRDEMFDYAAEGNIDFNHPAYGTIRTLMNGHIRFAHRIDSALILIFMVYFVFKSKEVNKQKKELQKRIESQMSSLPKEQKEKLSDYMERTHFELGKYVLYASPIFMILALVVGLLALILLIPLAVVGRVSIREWIKDIEYVELLDPAAFSEAKRNSALAA